MKKVTLRLSHGGTYTFQTNAYQVNGKLVRLRNILKCPQYQSRKKSYEDLRGANPLL